MAKDPAVLLYTSDFLTGTMTMTNEQVGKYIRLLCLQHQKTNLSEKDMMSVCKTYDEDIFCKFIKSENGFYNERLRIEAEKRASYCNSRRKNKTSKNIRESYVKHMEDENEDVIVIKDKNKEFIVNIDFEIFWNLYPNERKTKKQYCKIYWNKNLNDKEREDIIRILPFYEKSVSEIKYIKQTEYFFKNKKYEDESFLSLKDDKPVVEEWRKKHHGGFDERY